MPIPILSRHRNLRTLPRRIALFTLIFATAVAQAIEVEPPGPWEGFPRTQPTPRYESDIGAKPDYQFGVTKAFSPYKDPDRAEAEGLANPLDNPDFASYNLIVIVNKRDDTFWGHGQTLRVYKRDVGLLYYWLISSGAKGFETTSGYYRPQLFSSRHWSGKYDAPMLWAVFFNGGMALHSSLDRESMKEMGQAAASHGCVHVEDYRSEELFHLVGHSGYGAVDVIDRGTGSKTGGKAQSYKTLIIIAPVNRWGQKAASKTVKTVIKPGDTKQVSDDKGGSGKKQPTSKTAEKKPAVQLKNIPAAKQSAKASQ